MDELTEDMARWIAETFYQMECESGQKIYEIYEDKLGKEKEVNDTGRKNKKVRN